MITVRTYSDNGPYFAPTQGIYQANSLKELLFHTRLCMEDGDYQIGIFNDDGECKGFWVDEAEPIDDGEGCMVLGPKCYVLYRPGSISKGLWNLHLAKFKRA